MAVPRGTTRVPPAPTAMRARGTGSALHAGSPTSRQAPQKNDLLARSMGRSLPAALDCAGGWEGRRMWWPHLRAGRVRGSLRFSKQSKTEGATSQSTATASSGRARTHAGALHLGGAPARPQRKGHTGRAGTPPLQAAYPSPQPHGLVSAPPVRAPGTLCPTMRAGQPRWDSRSREAGLPYLHCHLHGPWAPPSHHSASCWPPARVGAHS